MSGRAFPVAGARWPTAAAYKYGALRSYEKHQGVDILAPEGTPVVAAADGVVILVVTGFTPAWRGYGRTIAIRHAGQHWTLYTHLSRSSVTRGQVVRAGQPIGAIGRTRWDTAALETFVDSPPHTHFEALTRFPPRARTNHFTIVDRTDPKAWLLRNPARGAGVGAALLAVAVLL